MDGVPEQAVATPNRRIMPLPAQLPGFQFSATKYVQSLASRLIVCDNINVKPKGKGEYEMINLTTKEIAAMSLEEYTDLKIHEWQTPNPQDELDWLREQDSEETVRAQSRITWEAAKEGRDLNAEHSAELNRLTKIYG